MTENITDDDETTFPILLEIPRGGVPPVIATDDELSDAIALLRGGTGPVGIDTERASGYRYSQRAYLVQLYRENAGTFIVDPTAFDDLAPISEALSDVEHILHAASQDLPSLREAKYIPTRIFDTELSARLLSYERVGLGALVEKLLGIHLTKAHSAADWSTRPLPDSWVSYAALDVQLLPQLRDLLFDELKTTGKWEYAQQEFDATLHARPKPALPEPWRKLSGVHSLRRAPQLAVARALWQARDAVAREIDIAPGRILPDSAIIAASTALPSSKGALIALAEFRGRYASSRLDDWWEAIEKSTAEPLPSLRPRGTHIAPPLKSWKSKNPLAAARLDNARSALSALAETHNIPTENLLSPAALRQVIWSEKVSRDQLAPALRSEGARAWQVNIVVPAIAEAIEQADIRYAAESDLVSGLGQDVTDVEG